MSERKENFWWDIQKPLSYNCLWNFIIGNRGAGKTYGSLKWAIEQHLKALKKKEKWQFLYVRRNKTELEKLTQCKGGRLFKAVADEFPTHKLRAESNVLWCDENVLGYAQPLSTASILKSDNFPDVYAIIFDEFIIDNTGTYHYLKDEVRKFLDLYETVARLRDNVRVFFLSNAVSIANPYFDFFHLNRPHNGDIQRFGPSKDILVQNVAVSEMIAYKEQTRFGRMIAGTEYADYAIRNEWLLDNTDFIEKKTECSEYFVSLCYKGHWLGVWIDRNQWLFYVSFDCDENFPLKYSVTTDDHKPNMMLFKAGKRLSFLKALIDAYECGAVRYENLKLKSWFRDIMRMSRL